MTLVANPALVPHHDTGRGTKRPADDVAAHMARYRPGMQAPDGFRLPASEDDVEGDGDDAVQGHGGKRPADPVLGGIDDVEGHGYKKPMDPPGPRSDHDIDVAEAVAGLHHP